MIRLKTESENIMRENNCCFTGHRELYESENIIYQRVLDSVKRLMEKGVKTFICGGAIGFDLLCGEVIANLRKEGEKINLVMALPCKGQDKYFSPKDKERYKALLESADKVIYVSEGYFRGCMHKRNRFMADNSAYLISYVVKNSGGSFYTKSYAEKNGLEIINVAQG